MRFNELLTGVREDVAIKLFGEDLNILASKAQEMGALISNIPGVADLKVEATDGLPQITVKYNRLKVAQYGLNINELNTTLQTAFAGGKAGVIFEGEKRFDLVVRFSEDNRTRIEDLQNLFVNLPNGSQIPLREVAKISYEPGHMQISRDNTNRRTYVGINIRDRDVQSVVLDIQNVLDEKFELPPGYFIRYGGAFENLERASSKLKTVVPIALVLIFVLIYFALKSFPQTVMIYLAIPMATIGGILALWLRGMPFSISAGVGFIVLFGVAVLNGLVMVSGLNELKEEGVTNLKDRILQGTKRRIRPILLTAFTDILGFLPMAISVSAGAEVQRPLATVVIGGLITSTLLTLFILPICYHWVEQRSFRSIKLQPKYAMLLSIVACLFFPLAGYSQEKQPVIALEEAVTMSKENFPLLKAKALEITKQESFKSSVLDLGTTKVFTSGEEIGDNRGIYTPIGLGQQNIDLLGISAKNKLLKQKVAVAESALLVSELQLELEVKKAWATAYVANQKLNLYKELDSVYGTFLSAVSLNYEVESISKLEYASAKNQALQISNSFRQYESEFQISLEHLNLWLASKEFYTVPDALVEQKLTALPTAEGLLNHPELLLVSKELDKTEAAYTAAKADLLPKFNIQGGLQRVNGNSGFYSYQAGISIPLLSGEEQSLAKASKVNTQILQLNASYKQEQLTSKLQQALQRYNTNKVSWEFYKDDALQLAKQQRDGALLAYKEGAIDYAAFTQIIKEAIDVELHALQALDQYLISLFQLQYYTR